MGRTVLGKAGPSPVQKLNEATEDINTKSTLNNFLNHKINCTVVSTSKAERELATQKLQLLVQSQGWLLC